jgi:hypothetical protein
MPAIRVGPSDIDALVVTRAILARPVRLERYFLCDQKLNIVRQSEEDVFNDVLLVDVNELQSWLESRLREHRCLIVDAWRRNGVTLRRDEGVNRVLSNVSDSNDCEIVTRTYFERRMDFFRRVLRERDATVRRTHQPGD